MNRDLATSPANDRVAKLLRDAAAAEAAGDLKLSLFSLKQAALLNPGSGDLHARLGITLLKTGEPLAAERELRQAWRYNVTDEVVVPPLLQAMLTRGENAQLLVEFPDPADKSNKPGDKPNKMAADILRARAVAFQAIGRPMDADSSMDRSLALRRDSHGLDTRAQMAAQQNDLALGLRLANEAEQLDPDDEDTLIVNVLLLRQQNQSDKALSALNAFVSRHPKSIVAMALRADVFLALGDVARARQDADGIVALNPELPIGGYYQALVTARVKGVNAGWHQASVLPPDFVQSSPAIAMTLAQLAVSAGSIDSATAILATIVARHPEVAQARVELAVLRMGQKNLDLALQALEPLADNGNPRVQALIAQVYLGLGRYREAIAALQQATASGAVERVDVLKRQLAQSEFQVGNAEKAVQELQQLAMRDPANLDAALQLAGTLASSGKTDDALREIDRAAKLHPKSPLPPFYRGEILILSSKLAAASESLSQAAAIDPNFVPAYYSRATTAIARGRSEDAERDLKTITARDPANVPAGLLLAQIAFNNGREADAISIVLSVIRAAPKDPLPRLALARYQFRQHKYADAQAVLDDVLKISPDNPDAIALQGQILFATGAREQALENYRKLVTKYPRSPDVQSAWANALNRVGNRIDAEAAAAKAADLAPDAPQYRSALIALQMAHGKSVDALLTAQAFRDLHPGPIADVLLSSTLILLRRDTDAEALLTASFAASHDRRVGSALSQLEYRLGKAKAAVGLLAEAVKRTPNDFELRRQYALLLIQIGDQPGATREFDALLKQQPEDSTVLNELGRLIEKDDPERALAYLSLAAKIDPLSATIKDNLGWMKLQRNDAPGALPLLQRAHALNSLNPEFSYHYALALNATGQREVAKSLLKSVLARNSKFADAKNAQELIAHW